MYFFLLLMTRMGNAATHVVVCSTAFACIYHCYRARCSVWTECNRMFHASKLHSIVVESKEEPTTHVVGCACHQQQHSHTLTVRQSRRYGSKRESYEFKRESASPSTYTHTHAYASNEDIQFICSKRRGNVTAQCIHSPILSLCLPVCLPVYGIKCNGPT